MTEGPLFRPLSWHGRAGAGLSDRSVAEIVKTRAALAGYEAREFGGHSLRSGFVTTAGRQGVSLGDAMALSECAGWTSNAQEDVRNVYEGAAQRRHHHLSPH